MADLVAMRAAVKEAMAYPLGGGVSVDSVFESLKVRAQAPMTREEHLRLLEAFVYALGDHHVHLSTNDKRSPRLVPSDAHVWTEWRAGALVVSELRRRSRPLTQEASLREGMAIVTIDGIPTEQALKPPPSVPDRAEAMKGFAGRVALAGTRDKLTTVTARDDAGRTVEVVIPGASTDSANTSSQGGDHSLASLTFPRANVAMIRLNNSIGNTDLTPVFDDLMQRALAMRTLILDLRNTPSGGDSVVAKPMMAWFVDGKQGYQRHERGAKAWVEQVEGRKGRFHGKLIVLVDHWTGSMGEGAAIGLRAAAGAVLVGTPMAGLRGAIESFDVPCFGVSIRLPVERLYEVSGGPRELAIPDSLVSEEDLAAATHSEDVILNRALLLAALP
jgi:carboxyl-terminal processing protease